MTVLLHCVDVAVLFRFLDERDAILLMVGYHLLTCNYS
jgi:hypothetical protein